MPLSVLFVSRLFLGMVIDTMPRYYRCAFKIEQHSLAADFSSVIKFFFVFADCYTLLLILQLHLVSASSHGVDYMGKPWRIRELDLWERILGKQPSLWLKRRKRSPLGILNGFKLIPDFPQTKLSEVTCSTCIVLHFLLWEIFYLQTLKNKQHWLKSTAL